MCDSVRGCTFQSSRGSGKLGSDGPNGLKDQEISNPIGMAATVRAVFEIAMQRTSVRRKGIVREEREATQPSAGFSRPLAEEAPSKASAGHGASTRRGATTEDRSRNRRMERERQAGASARSGQTQTLRRNRMPVRAPVTEPAECDPRIANQRQRHWAPSAFLVKDHALVRVGSTFGSAPFALGPRGGSRLPSPEPFIRRANAVSDSNFKEPFDRANRTSSSWQNRCVVGQRFFRDAAETWLRFPNHRMNGGESGARRARRGAAPRKAGVNRPAWTG